ncbi:MAG: alpha/beta hydrolase-fold protein [Maioricimonas sp. JB045]
MDVSPERELTFRVYAPTAETVSLRSSDIPDLGFAREMKKGEDGIWTTAVGPVPAGAYRYGFDIDGISIADPRNPETSESNMTVSSLVVVPGSDTCDVKDVPHGAVAEVTYYSKSLQRFRRMHVYTPPGYAKGEGRYPVLYLLHGASDGDDSWSSVGRAGFILDNLIATETAKPMLVVMPHGHTGPFSFGRRDPDAFDRQMEEFQTDFRKDIRPYIESHYRVIADRDHRALAGLSMGGAQTLNIGFADLQDYGYLGVFSSGVFGIAGGFGGSGPSDEWEQARLDILDNADLKEGLRLVWFATGREDFLLTTSQKTVEMLRGHEFDITYEETEGGHVWLNWRDYLARFAPLLFND